MMDNKIQIMFSTRYDPISLLIRFFTWSYWSHVDFVDGDYVIGATGLDGVRKDTLEHQKAKVHKWAIYEFDGDNIEMRKVMNSIIGKPYDYSAIVGFLFRTNWEHTDRWFCSEAIVWAARKIGVNLISDKKHRVTPRDLSVSPLLIRVESSG